MVETELDPQKGAVRKLLICSFYPRHVLATMMLCSVAMSRQRESKAETIWQLSKYKPRPQDEGVITHHRNGVRSS